MGPAVAEALAIYGEWLGIKVTDCGAWSTANQAFQRNYCATHDGRTADQHHGYMATVFAEFFEHRESGFSAGSRV